MLKKTGNSYRFNPLSRSTLLLFITTILLCALSGCSPTPSETDIKNDIENYEQFTNLDVEMTSFEIVKRLTDRKEKTDKVFVSITGNNDHYSIRRNYLMTYIKYNDGWQLETIGFFSDEGYQNTTTPLHGVPFEQVSAFERSIDFHKYASMDGYSKFSARTPLPESSEKNCLEILSDGICRIETQITYNYYTFDEFVSLPIIFDFYGSDSEKGSYGWYPSLPDTSHPDYYLERSLALSKNIVGLWGSDKNGFDIPGRLKITSYTENECYAELFYARNNQKVSGKLILEYSQRENGKLYFPRLVWKNEDAPDKSYYTTNYSIHLDSFEKNTIMVSSWQTYGYWGKLSS